MISAREEIPQDRQARIDQTMKFIDKHPGKAVSAVEAFFRAEAEIGGRQGRIKGAEGVIEASPDRTGVGAVRSFIAEKAKSRPEVPPGMVRKTIGPVVAFVEELDTRTERSLPVDLISMLAQERRS